MVQVFGVWQIIPAYIVTALVVAGMIFVLVSRAKQVRRVADEWFCLAACGGGRPLG